MTKADRTKRMTGLQNENLHFSICNFHFPILVPRLVLSLSLLTAGCDLPGRPNSADRPAPPEQSLEFGVLFGRNCAGCHGYDGELGPAPPLNDPLFRAIVPAEELQAVLTKGRNHFLMPAFAKENGGMLTEAQIQVLVMEIKGIPYKIVKNEEDDAVKVEVVPDAGGIVPAWGAPDRPPKGIPLYREPAATSSGSRTGDKKQGAVVFARACAVCHGERGVGIQEEGATIRAIHKPAMLSLTSNQVLRRYVITGRPDLDMPNFAKARPDNSSFTPLTDQDVADLVALLASWRRE